MFDKEKIETELKAKRPNLKFKVTEYINNLGFCIDMCTNSWTGKFNERKSFKTYEDFQAWNQ